MTRDRFVVESGTHDLRIGSDADHITQSVPLSVHGDVIPPRDLTRVAQAQDFDDYSGVTLTDQSKASGTSVAATKAGDWISFADTALPAGRVGLTAQVADAGTTRPA